MAELLNRSRVATLVGPPGIGKTRLALETAARIAHRHRDGAALAGLAMIGDPALVPRALASAISLQELPVRPSRTR